MWFGMFGGWFVLVLTICFDAPRWRCEQEGPTSSAASGLDGRGQGDSKGWSSNMGKSIIFILWFACFHRLFHVYIYIYVYVYIWYDFIDNLHWNTSLSWIKPQPFNAPKTMGPFQLRVSSAALALFVAMMKLLAGLVFAGVQGTWSLSLRDGDKPASFDCDPWPIPCEKCRIFLRNGWCVRRFAEEIGFQRFLWVQWFQWFHWFCSNGFNGSNGSTGSCFFWGCKDGDVPSQCG